MRLQVLIEHVHVVLATLQVLLAALDFVLTLSASFAAIESVHKFCLLHVRVLVEVCVLIVGVATEGIIYH